MATQLGLISLLSLQLPVHGQALDAQHQKQELEKNRVSKFCDYQFKNAQWLSAIQKDDSPSYALLASIEKELAGYRFISTSKGVQGVSGGVEQQAGGRWKCDRGLLEKPMILGKQYVAKTPVYEARPGCLGFGFSRLLRANCFSPARLIGYQSEAKMVKDEQCRSEARCLVLYSKDPSGKVDRVIIGYSVASLKSLFPFYQTAEYAYTKGGELKCSGYWRQKCETVGGGPEYKTWISHRSLDCWTYGNDEGGLQEKYMSCLSRKAYEW
jgi:hypothetical protein